MPLTFKQKSWLWMKGFKTLLAKAIYFADRGNPESNFALAEELYRLAIAQEEVGARFQFALFLNGQNRNREAAQMYFKAFRSGDLCAKAGLLILSALRCPASDFYLGRTLRIAVQFFGGG